jgi:ubiquinone/menaquinone biosynthesis C-methylase UbiE
MRVIAQQRRKIVPLATGRVLDVGTGGGANLPLFDPMRVSGVVGIDPDRTLLGYAKKRAKGLAYRIELLPVGAEDEGLESAGFDCVVLTYTLCSIARVEPALANLRRVLKPGGRLLFCEHGAAPDAHVRRWQDRLTPLWRRLAGGCHLNRDTLQVLGDAGFGIESVERFYLRHAPRFVGYHTIGMALADRAQTAEFSALPSPCA